MREIETLHRILSETLERRAELGDLDVDGSMLYELILKGWSEFIVLRIGSDGRLL
jgi:hypothetical protein